MSEEMDETIKGIAKGGAILFLGSVISKIIMYFYRVFVARELGPADYGLLSIGLAVFWISLALTDLGVDDGVQRKISSYLGRGKEHRIPAVIWAAISTTVPLSILSAAILFLFSDSIAAAVHTPNASYVIKILAIGLPFQMVYKNSIIITKSFRDVRYITYIDQLFKNLIILGVTAALIYRGYGIMGAVVAWFVAILISSLLMLYIVQYRVYPFLTNRTREIGAEGRKLLSYSWPLFFTGIAGLTMNWTDTILLGILKTPQTAGIYNAAFPTARTLMIVATGFGTVMFPTISKYYGQDRKKDSTRIASIFLKWIFVLTLPGLLIMVFFAKPLLQLLFGSEYTGGAVALSILGTAYLIQNMSFHAPTYIKSEDRNKLLLYNSLGAVSINIALNLALIPLYGEGGAALATAASITATSVAAVLQTRYIFDVKVYKPQKYIPALVSGLLSATIVYFMLDLYYSILPPLIIIPVLPVFGVLYLAGFILLGGFEDEDIMLLNEISNRTGIDLSSLEKPLRKAGIDLK